MAVLMLHDDQVPSMLSRTEIEALVCEPDLLINLPLNYE